MIRIKRDTSRRINDASFVGFCFCRVSALSPPSVTDRDRVTVLCTLRVTMSRCERANERTSERSSARDAKGDVKLETKRVDAERQSVRKRRGARCGVRIDVTFVNLSEKDTKVREAAGRRVEKRKTKGVSTCLPFA